MKAKPLFAGIAAGLLAGPSHLLAQASWVGTGTSGTPATWSDSLNWTGIAPTNGSTINGLTFSNSANSFSNNDLTGLTVNGISIPNTLPTRDNTVTGNAITLAGGITVGTGNWQTFNIGMALGNAARSMAVSTGRLYLGGVLSGSGGAITKTGGGELYLTNANTFTGNGTNTALSSIAGAGSYGQGLLFSGGGSGTVVIQNTAALGSASNSVRFSGSGSGVLDLQTDSSVNSWAVFSGSGNGGTINAGRATSGAGFMHNLGVLDLSSVTMTVNTGSNVASGTAGVSFTSLSMSGGNDNNPVTLAGSAAISIGNAGITNNTNVTRRLQLDGTHANNSIGTISDLAPGAAAGTGKINLIKANNSTWTLTGNNSYTGTTSIQGGTLQLGNGGSTGALSPSSAITNNATLAINRSNTVTQGTDFASTVSGTGSFRKSGNGNLVLNAENLASGTAREVLTFSGSNSGTVTLTHSAALGAAGNTIRFSGGGSGVLDLQTDTGVNTYNIVSGSFNGGTIIANRATSGGSITHTLGSLDLGSVTLTINKGSNVTGSAAVSFTELRMNGGNDFNPVTVAGNADIALGSASITANGFSKRLQLDGTSTNNIVTGVLSDSNNAVAGAVVNVIKANSGTWTLNSDNTYTGTTTIKAGTLRINTSTAIATSSSITVGDDGSSGAVLDASAAGLAIASSQTVGGIGTILSTGQSVTSSGTLAPGNSVGSLSISGGSLVLNASSDFIFELGLSSDRINLINSASLALGTGTLGLSDFTFINSGGFGIGTYTLIHGASSFSGSLDSTDLTGSVLGFDSILGMSGNHLVLTVIPEPRALLLGAAGLLALLRRRR
jgi:autotransporter-associated beta strand protein